MERTAPDGPLEPIELGSATAATQGNGGVYWEAAGLMPHAGITED